MTDSTFTEEYLPVSDLIIDRDVQRSFLNIRRVEHMVLHYNPAALGVITVSRRNAATNAVVDGMHRVETIRRVTTNAGEVLCHVFTNLTKAEEAQMFLDLNFKGDPSLTDRFRVRIIADDPDAKYIDKITRAYGWVISPTGGKGKINAVGTVEKILKAGRRIEFEPELLQATLMVASHAWGNDEDAVRATLLEGVAAVIVEYQSALDLKRLEERLKYYTGGPHQLYLDGKQFAASRKIGRVSMGVAERIVDDYNTGMKTRALTPWRKHK